MKIEPKSIKVKDIFDGYADNGDNGVFASEGRLAIRPAYQREFVYSLEQAESVIHTILKGFPLNVMYWVKVGDDQYEVLDGQQRTLSVMQYLDHKYSISVDGGKYYCDSLPDDKYDDIMFKGIYLNDYIKINNKMKSNLRDKYFEETRIISYKDEDKLEKVIVSLNK